MSCSEGVLLVRVVEGVEGRGRAPAANIAEYVFQSMPLNCSSLTLSAEK